VFSFDPVGSYERETYRAGGSAASMLQPLLDNQVYTCTNMTLIVDYTALYSDVFA
jgi:20S proteasome alpha/beta subunit